MGGKISQFWKTSAQKESEGKLILPGQLDAEDEIANYASINGGDSATPGMLGAGILRRSYVNCPTCQGTGRIPREQEEQLVALIPYGDQRLKPRRTKLYVCLAVTICLLMTSLSIFFLFPRSITVLPAGLNASSIGFDVNTTSIYLNMTNVLNITNSNFYLVTAVQLDIEVLHQSLVVGKTNVKTLLNVSPLQSGQIYYMVASIISDDNTYNICTWTKVRVHNVLLHLQGTLTCTYLCHSEQVAFEDYQYVDCRGNATLPHALYRRPP
ncbi:transmembrane protein 106A [Anas acuta]|uniref:transmembrane protein 106A n=1 Tax=Anas acuta TaxID=28680 RepID=UPI000F7C2FD5|nr:transmembrane protein 106A [Anas platyrhynchos]XP_027301388.1 transmembrane protein 106A [Anas platyrhynchos]XP_027301389.1 transmembrane protein 106A [Anas platyrhynchos]|eukprot:XP_027301387.1 transmembrane protein 106A [Anas platyrhynchos]